MALVRFGAIALLLAAALCFGLYALNGGRRWRDRGVRLLQLFIVLAAVFFGVLAIERLV
jgi:hypothetical protein